MKIMTPYPADPLPISEKSTAYRIALSAALAALALIFSYIEVLIPFLPALPGVKLGIANLVIIIALYKLGFRYALIIDLIRIAAAGVLFTGAFATLYSLSGAVISLIVMYLLMKSRLFSVTGVSMAGGAAHNTGQLLAAALIVSTSKVFVYFSVLVISGVLCGAFIGVIAFLIMKKISFSSFSLYQ